MGNEKIRLDRVRVEFQVSIHCKACERTVARAVSKCKGVETFSTDMANHRVIVKGRVNPINIQKNLKKKTGKKVEIIVPNKEVVAKPNEEDDSTSCKRNSMCDDWDECQILTMFSDENPNACSIM
ncbi:hypothetical protein C5167_000256 [Papaver somniferum]|uniref:HMA domain-containing protein n=1 Tax=Papaver somniferum TaxID=3469 RepID=A0A4Y7KTJ6_PAPSO|nr:hypothetical protein C5167_000256 [Papaver somniferum]